MSDTLARTDTPPRWRPIFRVQATEDGTIDVKAHPDRVARCLLGEGGDPAVAVHLLEHLAGLSGSNPAGINASIALVAGLEPRDAAEAILATQIVAVSNLALRLHRQVTETYDTRGHADLARTALAASRTVGELIGRIDALRRPASSTQKIIVERVDAAQVAIGCGAPSQGGEGGE